MDVGNIQPAQVEQYILNVRDKLKRSPLITESDGTIDYKFQVECIHLSTIIPLTDGRNLSLEQIIKEYGDNDKNLETYSIDRINKKIVPGKITWAGVTRKNAELIKVYLDNDSSSFIVTPDHKFLMRDGEYKEA
ncbi:MAG: hypothetical protein KKB59_18815, partial [Spirochaetes bacterium]|nr:hypothetical protein [Spirochaetota bacterium]